MKRINSHQFLSTLIFFTTIFLTTTLSQPKDSLITKVENELLPVVLIEGEPPFNLKDRMEYYNVPGISITVIKDYKIEWKNSMALWTLNFRTL